MVESDNLHVCLSFLGNISDSELSSISERLDEITSHHRALEVEVKGMKLIPSKNYMRVIMLDLSSESGSLKKISLDIKNTIGGSVHPPHITLCRVRGVPDKRKFLSGIEKIRNSVSDKRVKFFVKSISLLKSQLSPSGPRYTVIKEFVLRR